MAREPRSGGVRSYRIVKVGGISLTWAWLAIAGLALLGLPASPVSAVQPVPTIAEFVDGMSGEEGFLSYYFDETEGRIFLEVANLGEDMLHVSYLATGIGWDLRRPPGSELRLRLDRGTSGQQAVVRFERNGPNLMLRQANDAFRVLNPESDDQVRVVEESFPTSILAALPIKARNGDRFLVDVTDFLLQDHWGVPRRIAGAGQGDFRVDRQRSAVHLARTGAFPSNTEINTILTFESDNPGPEIRRVAPNGHAVTIHQHHSFVELPDEGYRPRSFNPRINAGAFSFEDFSQSIDEGYQHQRIRRWRLEKADPDAELSEPVEPIVFHIDPGTPEPWRSNFAEGVAWWNEILEVAGFQNAIRIEEFPADADPMDVRYSVMQWIHRSGSGPAVSGTVRDPRTGEILRAMPRMESRSVFGDFNLYATLRSAAAETPPPGPTDVDPAALDWLASLDPMMSGEEFAMTRRRHTAAHEIGHDLGFSHNYGWTPEGRVSCLGSLPENVRLREDGTLDLADVFQYGCSSSDSLSIRYAYTPFDPDEEEEGLKAIVQEGIDAGARFISDRDAMPVQGSIPWVRGIITPENLVTELERVMEVRAVILERFNESAIAPGDPMWLLNERLAPAYYFHLSTLNHVIKAIGGFEYEYSVRGLEQSEPSIVDAELQRAALDAILHSLRAEVLEVPEHVIRLMHPPPFGSFRTERNFPSSAGPAFDAISAARSLASHTLSGVFFSDRAARLVAFHARDESMPSLEEVMGRFVEELWAKRTAGGDMEAAINRAVQRALVDVLMDLASDASATVDVRGMAEWHLSRLDEELESRLASGIGNAEEAAHFRYARQDIHHFLSRTDDGTLRSAPFRITPPSGFRPSDGRRDG